MDTPTAVTRAAILLEKQPITWRRAHGGYTPAERWLVDFATARPASSKPASRPTPPAPCEPNTTSVYSRLDAPFLPRLLAWEDDDVPLLVLEDLSAAYWPPPWTRDQVDAVLRTLDAIHAVSLPGLPDAAIEGISITALGHRRSRTQPLSCASACARSAGCTTPPASFEREQGEAACVGSSLCHVDVRSDNICIAGDRVVFVDWNFASQGNGEMDIAAWLPSLHAEGGPAPEEVLPRRRTGPPR